MTGQMSVVIGFAGCAVSVVVYDPDVFLIGNLIGNRTPEDIATDLRISTRTVQRWIQSGVNWDQADVFASKVLHRHPCEIWGQQWEEAANAACPEDDQLALFE